MIQIADTSDHGNRCVGRIRVVPTDVVEVAEIKSMAVRESLQRNGIDALLVQHVIAVLAAESIRTVPVATAAADVGNLRFHQRQGFRFQSIERDAFTPAHGYPPGLVIDGIPLRDRVWLDRPTRL